MARSILLSTLAAAVGLLMSAGGPAQAQSFTDFESFTTGLSVNGQGGWRATNPNWDEEVVDLAGDKAWRVSNEVVSGSFGDQPFAAPSGLYAGESASTHLFSGNPAVTKRFIASFDFWSVTGAAQPGLDVTVSPDDGQGSRQSFISIEDNGAGIDIDFFDTDNNHPVTNQNGGFRFTQIATGLAYDQVHTVTFDITFVDGNFIDPGDGTVHGNDIVRVYVDNALIHTGTTWESYFWTTVEGQTPPSVRAIDTLLFRLSTNNAFDGSGVGGYYIDNVSISGPPVLTCAGFEAPLDNGPVKVKKNRALPLKAEVQSGEGFPLTDGDLASPPVIQVVLTPGGGDPVDVSDDAVSTGKGTDGNQFQFDGTNWAFNLGTKNYTAPGTYQVTMVSGDITEYVIDPTCMATFVID